jgi:acyl dehydratase
MVNLLSLRNDGTVDTTFRQIFTMLEFSKAQCKNATSDSIEFLSSPAIPHSAETTMQVSLSADDPLKWAAICKDYNSIHLAGAAAKIFSLAGKIAHGNRAVAKALQRLMNSRGSRLLLNTLIWMELQFKKPMVAPGVFYISVHETGQTAECGSLSAMSIPRPYSTLVHNDF